MLQDVSLMEVCTAFVLPALQEVLGSHLRGVVIKGSAVHGDFIPGYSDLDVHVFVDDEALIAPQTLPTADALALQSRLGSPVDALPISAVQLYVLSWREGYPADWVKPWPGTYEVAYGELPPGFTDVDAGQYRRSAHGCMRLFPAWKQTIVRRVICCGDAVLPDIARELGAIVKPMAFVAATLVTGMPREIWSGSLDAALATIEPRVSPLRRFSAFFAGVRNWPPDADQARFLIRAGSEAVDDVAVWYAAQRWSPADLEGVREMKPW